MRRRRRRYSSLQPTVKCGKPFWGPGVHQPVGCKADGDGATVWIPIWRHYQAAEKKMFKNECENTGGFFPGCFEKLEKSPQNYIFCQGQRKKNGISNLTKKMILKWSHKNQKNHFCRIFVLRANSSRLCSGTCVVGGKSEFLLACIASFHFGGDHDIIYVCHDVG